MSSVFGNRQGGGGGLKLNLLPVIIGAVAVGGMMLKGCQEGPFGRKQMVAMGQAEEKALGAQAFQEVTQTADVVPAGPLVKSVEGIAQRLIAASKDAKLVKDIKLKPNDFAWELKVVRDKQVNAFCLPGGKIVVYTGILPVAETEAGLATVMGHEIAHALASHGAERMAQTKLAQAGIAAVGSGLGDTPGQRDQIMMVLNAGAKFGILKYSRSHESEADHIGLLIMAKAGYNPIEAVKFWERMSKVSGGGAPPEFMSTHPSHGTRVRDLEEWQAQAKPLYDASAKLPDVALPRAESAVPAARYANMPTRGTRR